MFAYFKKAAAPLTAPYIAEAAILDTRKHGAVKMNRLQLSTGEVAYVCHMAARPEDAILNAGRIHFESIDRSSNREDDLHSNQLMSEETPPFGKSDFLYAAEQACDNRLMMNNALIVVFFDVDQNNGRKNRNCNTLSANDIIREVRDHFPASRFERDVMEEPVAAPAKRAEASATGNKPTPPTDFHYSC